MSFFAFKGFDKDLKCRGFQYEIGKTYSMPEKPIICERGFHCCQRLVDVFNYYSPKLGPIGAAQSSNRFCLVEVCGDVDIEKGVYTNKKYATNSITIVRELPTDEIIEILDREADIAKCDWLQTENFANGFRVRNKDKRKKLNLWPGIIFD